MLVLAGVASAGKSTLAKKVSQAYGIRYIEVEAEKCWPIRYSLVRQLCFIRTFYRRIMRPLDLAVADNSLLTVYGYTRALAKQTKSPGMRQLAALARMLAIEEARIHNVILLLVDEDSIRRRIARRLLEETNRRHNVVETWIDLHIEAQKYMEELARHLHDVIIIDNSDSKKRL